MLQHLSKRTNRMGVSAIREILKVVSQPGMVSLAGGLPAPESFPLDTIQQVTNTVFEKYGSRALQYDATEGFTPLREALLDHLRERDIRAELETITVFSGSQSVLDAMGKICISPGDTIAVAAPTYLGALAAFNAYEPEYASIASDKDGVIPEALDHLLQTKRTRLVYLVPTFQNPTGRSLPLERRQRIAEIITKHDVLLLEDDPYSELRYEGQKLPSIHTFAPDHVIYCSTMSKSIAPGMRIGFCIAPVELSRWLVIAKQATDLHTQTFGQAITAEYLRGGYFEQQVLRIIALYRPRRDAMVAALQEYFPTGFAYHPPQGGMFLWVTAPDHVNTLSLYHQCVEQNVAFVPGKFFFTEPDTGENTMRLNFTSADETTIAHAIRVIGEVAKHHRITP